MRATFVYLLGLAALPLGGVVVKLSMASDSRPAPAADPAHLTTPLFRSDLATVPDFVTVAGKVVAGDTHVATLTVPETTQVTAGQAVELESVARPGEIIHANIGRVGVASVEVVLPEGTDLPAGTFLEARIATSTRSLPQVPRTAVVRNGASWRLWVAKDGTLTERVVQIGPASSPTHVTISRGLTAGEEVAVAGAPPLSSR